MEKVGHIYEQMGNSSEYKEILSMNQMEKLEMKNMQYSIRDKLLL